MANILDIICTLLHWAGLLKYHDHHKPYLNRLHHIYMYGQYTIGFLFVAFHTWNTISRASQDLSEFVSTAFESLLLSLALFECLTLCVQRDQVLRILQLIASFKQTSATVASRCWRKIRLMYVMFIPWILVFICTALMQVVFPLDEAELEIRKRLYP